MSATATPSRPRRLERVLNALRESGQLSTAGLQQLEETVARYDTPSEAGRALGDEIVEMGVRPQTIVDVLADVLRLERFRSDCIIVESGPDWAVSDERVCYMLNPLDTQRYQALLNNTRLGIQQQGILGAHHLDVISRADQSSGSIRIDPSDSADKLFDRIIQNAISNRSSDIHLEPVGARTEIRYRVDGMLSRFGTMDLEADFLPLANYILERSGNQAGEYLEPRDGQFSYPMRHREINLRMSMVPSSNGTSIQPRFALRLLGLEMDLVDIDEIGLSTHTDNDHMTAVKRQLSQTSGLIIVSGPTGSGKTTTLNAFLRWLSRTMPTRSSFSVEDPVEIENPMVTQVQINERAGVTFESALRAFLRQDPDNIMLGEIRDSESTSLVIRAALTGHLVLSTLHTKSSIGCVARLLDLGAQPDQLSEALSGLLAQRMVRKVCPYCSNEIQIEDYLELAHPWLEQTRGLARSSILEANARYGDMRFFPQHGQTIRLANERGCDHCRGGYSGRTSVVEFLEVDKVLADMISEGASRAALDRAADDNGFLTMWDHALQLIGGGITTFAEAERVLGHRALPRAAITDGV